MPCPFTGPKMFCADTNFLSQPKNLTALMPCSFTGPKMFCAGPNFWSQPKNLPAFSASSKTFVPAQKLILLNANHHFVWHKMPQYVDKFLVWRKKNGPAQNILGPVKGQGINENLKIG